jgi:hypothetical protein
VPARGVAHPLAEDVLNRDVAPPAASTQRSDAVMPSCPVLDVDIDEAPLGFCLVGA